MLSALGVAAVGVILALRRRRPWDAAMFALSPALLVTATVNWDLLAIGLAVFGHVRLGADAWPVAAGVLLGLGGAAKLWPLFLLGPLIVLALRSRRLARGADHDRRRRRSTVAGGQRAGRARATATSWDRFFELNTDAADRLGHALVHRPLPGPASGRRARAGAVPVAQRPHPDPQHLTYAAVRLRLPGHRRCWPCCAPRRPRLAQLAFLVVAAFLIFSKVWSQQFVLWLLPLVVLARPRWGAFLAWQVAEIGYFVAFYGELLGASGKQVFPEGVFVLASTLRLVGVAVAVLPVIREILRPELDVVRRTYADDPDGGDFDGAPRTRPAATGASAARTRDGARLTRGPSRRPSSGPDGVGSACGRGCDAWAEPSAWPGPCSSRWRRQVTVGAASLVDVGERDTPVERLVDEAVTLASAYVAAPVGPELLVNRDAHLDNILRAGRQRWLLIDPKPMLGEAAFEAGHPVLNAMRHRPPETMQPAYVDRLVIRWAMGLGADPARVRGWALIRDGAERAVGARDRRRSRGRPRRGGCAFGRGAVAAESVDDGFARVAALSALAGRVSAGVGGSRR